MMAAGVFGAWCGWLMPFEVAFPWAKIGGSGILAFLMSVGVGIITYRYRKRGR